MEEVLKAIVEGEEFGGTQARLFFLFLQEALDPRPLRYFSEWIRSGLGQIRESMDNRQQGKARMSSILVESQKALFIAFHKLSDGNFRSYSAWNKYSTV
ncbi:hypothetical protein L484_001244 [Morus notabilis]|uniref:Uncharacterized protein n=1 Tax=Morus notabilis TaxID=981085 RepID=W9RXX1_9ROSA|nr:hypothetical protein L484_001244 [Morus notabilis]